MGKEHVIRTSSLVRRERSESTEEKAPRLLYRIERFAEPDPERPTNYRTILARLQSLGSDIEKFGIATVVTDSITAFEMAGRFYSQFVDKPDALNQAEWFRDSTDWVERHVMVRMPSLVAKYHVHGICICHTSSEKDREGNSLKFCPDMPGRNATRFAAQYSEVYYIEKDEESVPRFYTSSKVYACTSVIGVQSGSLATFDVVQKALHDSGLADMKLCFLFHGRPGEGKSSAAATWPTPMLVLMFDAPGKDLPYIRRGTRYESSVEQNNIPVTLVYE